MSSKCCPRLEWCAQIITQSCNYYCNVRLSFGRQLKAPSGGIKIYISWKVRNPSAAVFDYFGDVNERSINGIELYIPWNDANSAGNRRKRSTEDVTGTVYGSLVGTEQKQNSFVLTQLSYKDSSTATSIKAGGLLTGILALLVVWLQYGNTRWIISIIFSCIGWIIKI